MFTFYVAVTIALGVLVGGSSSGNQAPLNDKPVAQVEAGGRCPKIYAPVICDNGKTYPNQCVADQHHAQNCEPTGGI